MFYFVIGDKLNVRKIFASGGELQNLFERNTYKFNKVCLFQT